MKHVLTFLFLTALIAAAPALARPVTQEYQLAPTDCQGDPISLSEYAVLEFYVDEQPIPVVAIDPCDRAPDGSPLDSPPQGAVLVPAVPADSEVTFSLVPGTYWIRGRVQDSDGDWSNLSNELSVIVPPGRKNPPVLIRITF